MVPIDRRARYTQHTKMELLDIAVHQLAWQLLPAMNAPVVAKRHNLLPVLRRDRKQCDSYFALDGETAGIGLRDRV